MDFRKWRGRYDDNDQYDDVLYNESERDEDIVNADQGYDGNDNSIGDQPGQAEKKRARRRKRWIFWRPLVAVAISLILVVSVVAGGYSFVMNSFLRPVNSDNAEPIIVEIKSGWGISSIANALYGDSPEERLIRSKTAFKIYIDFAGKSRKLRAGTYTFSQNMSISEIVTRIAGGESIKEKSMNVTLKEGWTVEDMADELVKQGLLSSSSEFLSLCKTGEGFENFDIPTQQPDQTRLYVLEGYLFPDTYAFYEGTSASVIINKLLTRFNDIWTTEYIERMEELDMSLDQIITLASIIEKEARAADFAKVSAVFHNRLQADMPLQSDVTVKYAIKEDNLYLTEAQISTDTPYNTHRYKGLPIGPIANPGKAAIEAALWPDESYITDRYLYFCLQEAESGKLAFSKTYNEHLALVEKYKDEWIAYDEQKDADQANGSVEQEASAAPQATP